MTHKEILTLALLGAFAASGQGVGVSWAAEKLPPLKKAPMSDDPMELYLQGAVLVATGEIDAAEKLARAALDKHGASHGFHLLLGDVQLRRQRAAEAFYEWQWEFLRAGPGTPTGDLATMRISNLLTNQRGTDVDEVRLVLDCVMLTPKDPKTAYAKLERIDRERGERFAIREFMAEALHTQGATDQAAAAYRDLLLRDPYFVPAYVQLALVLRAKGERAAADEVMLKARGIDPDNWRLKGM